MALPIDFTGFAPFFMNMYVEFGIRMEDTGTGKETVYKVRIKCDL